MAEKKIIINRSKCIGCGSCVACGEGKIKFIDGRAWADNSDHSQEAAQDIIDLCPVDAISAGTEAEYQQAYEQQGVQKEEDEAEDC